MVVATEGQSCAAMIALLAFGCIAETLNETAHSGVTKWDGTLM
jgi:hypothetical protein